MRGWKILTVFCILSLVILEFQQVHGQNLAIGQRCKKDGQCASGKFSNAVFDLFAVIGE